jgi:hypothetical protein
MTALRSVWVSLTTADVLLAGTDANLFLEFNASGKSFLLPDQPGNDLEMPSPLGSNGTTFLFDVNNLDTDEWVPGTVVLRNDATMALPKPLPSIPNAPLAGWRCKSILVVGLGEDGKVYPMVAMPHVDRWLSADEPAGLSIVLDILKNEEIGLPAGKVTLPA